MGKLEGKVAIVTGASKGIGASIAEHLAAEGAAVVVNYASGRDGAERVVRDITAKGGRAIVVQADVTRQADVDRLVAETIRAFGRLDVLVNNAGAYEFAALSDVTEAHVRRLLDLNVLAPVLVSKAAVAQFNGGGSVINVGSVVGQKPVPNASVYSASKAAIEAITRSLAAELGPRNVRVNAIAPGMVETEGWHAAGFAESDLRRQVEAQTPLARIGQPRDIAPAVVFLASDDAAWITGETLLIAGGLR